MGDEKTAEQQSLDLNVGASQEPAIKQEAFTDPAHAPKSATVAAPPIASPLQSAAPVVEEKKPVQPAKPFDEEVNRRMSRVDELEKSFNSLRTESEALRNRLDQELLNSRVNWAANKGVKGLTRDDLAMIMPKVDPSTPEGLAALDAWRQQRSDLFPDPTLPKTASPEQMMEKVDTSRNHFWTGNKFREIASSTMGKD
tara:strand:- start:1492 stop:2085 length:594 start_codon:yes stop_codon:yes gene_type:complete